jgi:H+-transporting ATPase
LVLVILTLLCVYIAYVHHQIILTKSSFYRSDTIVDLLNYTLAITIIGVPVGLPVCTNWVAILIDQAVVTTTMAVGAAYLAKKKAIVQKLSAIESLAGVEILCSDK